MSETPSALRGHAAMLLFSSLIAGSFSLGSMASPYIEPGPLNTVRFLLAAIVSAGVAAAMGKLPRSTFQASWRYLILGGIFVIYFMTMFEALKTVSAVSTSAVFTLTPLMSAVIGRVLLGQSMNPRVVTALLIGAIGALWVIFRADLQAFLSFDVGKGEMLFFVGCAAHAFYPAATRAFNRGESAMAVNAGMLAAGFLMLLVFNWSSIMATDWASMPNIVWITIFYTSFFSGVTTFTLLQFASMRLPGAKVMAYTYLVPSWVLVWQVFLGNGFPPTILLVGIGVTIIALLMLLRDD